MVEMLAQLEKIVHSRQQQPKPGSYTNQLLEAGLTRIAQKVGEEGVEVVVAALAQDEDALLGEMADWLYHATVLLAMRGISWEQVEGILRARHRPDAPTTPPLPGTGDPENPGS
ncbi:MAG: phosphoribosyl-ATP diphosphatase [Anaerolineae bacterium]|nr:phosphoribosyl-ATP diphosphatase [Anaerolineae bacterium]